MCQYILYCIGNVDCMTFRLWSFDGFFLVFSLSIIYKVITNWLIKVLDERFSSLPIKDVHQSSYCGD